MEGLGDVEEELELLPVERYAANVEGMARRHDAVPLVDAEEALAVARLAHRMPEHDVRRIISVSCAQNEFPEG